VKFIAAGIGVASIGIIGIAMNTLIHFILSISSPCNVEVQYFLLESIS